MRAARFAVLLGLVLVAAASRLVPHPPNLTPIAAMALFGGAYFPDKRAAYLVPLAAMFLSDLVLGLHRGWPVVYGSFMLIVCIGFWLRWRRTALRVACAAAASSLLFFVVTNFDVWARGSLYLKMSEELLADDVTVVPIY